MADPTGGFMKHSKEVDAYIRSQPKDVQGILQKVRHTIRRAAPDAEEAFKYRLPTFVLHGKNLAHFGGFRHHIGFYPTSSGTAAFRKELASYSYSKGSIRFPLDKPIPYGLIAEIVKFRVRENLSIKPKKKRPRRLPLSSGRHAGDTG
jgi:uncharacterized protein YdhG (YjbR/CyaY superfamily)